MGETKIWDHIWAWLRHPLNMASSVIIQRYLDRHGLVMEYADKYHRMHAAWRSCEQESMIAKQPG